MSLSQYGEWVFIRLVRQVKAMMLFEVLVKLL